MQIMYDRVRQLTEDPEIRMVLTGDDAEFMRSSLNTIGRSLETRQYARAWAALTHWRFWLLWKQFLEPAEQILARLPADQDKDPIGMRVLVAAPAETSVTVDGIPDEEIWKNVTWSSGFTTRDRLPGMAETGIKALYDDDNLYLAFICADRDVKAVKGSASWSFSGFDALVVFLQPDENESVYYQLGLNTGAGRFHQKVFGGERIYEVLPWTAKTAASEGYWTAEAVFPFKMFGMKDRGTGAWRINIHRIMRDQLADNSSWHFEPGNWHYPDFGNRQPFGRLTFQ